MDFLKNQDFIFQSGFRLPVKLRERYSDFPYTSCPNTCTASPVINSPHQSGTFITIDEPTLIHHNHSKSMVYITIHSWCWTFYRFKQMNNGMYPSLWYHTEYFHYTKNPLYSAHSSLPSYFQPLATTDLFTVQDFFRHAKAERIHYEQSWTTVSAEGSPSSRRKVIPHRNLDLHKEIKSNGNDKYMGKYKGFCSYYLNIPKRQLTA